MHQQMNPGSDSEQTGARKSVRTRNLVGIGIGTLALGLLIWAKLQLVVGVPRTAVATPDEKPRAGEVSTSPADSTRPAQPRH